MSHLRANTISDAAGTGPVALTKQSAAKAWINLDYTAGSPVLLSSLNASSITDNSAGHFTLNVSNAFAAGNDISTGGSSQGNTAVDTSFVHIVSSASAVGVYMYSVLLSAYIDDGCGTQLHGDLA